MSRKPPPPPEIDPNDPVAEFVLALSELLTGKEDVDPGELKRSLEAVLAKRPAPPRQAGLTAAEQARSIVESAADAGEEGAALALDALRLDPNCADAYVFLGADAGEESELAFVLFSLAILAASEALGTEVFEKHAGEFFDVPGGESLLRAMEGAGYAALASGALAQAVSFFGNILELDHEDHLDARYAILSIAMSQGDGDLAASLFQAFDDDDPVWRYSQAIHEFRAHGDRPQSRAALRKAIDLNAHVLDFLVGGRPLPRADDEDEGPGSETEGAMASLDLFPLLEQTRGLDLWFAAGREAAHTGRRQWFIFLD